MLNEEIEIGKPYMYTNNEGHVVYCVVKNKSEKIVFRSKQNLVKASIQVFGMTNENGFAIRTLTNFKKLVPVKDHSILENYAFKRLRQYFVR